jgi:hypothetical protein
MCVIAASHDGPLHKRKVTASLIGTENALHRLHRGKNVDAKNKAASLVLRLMDPLLQHSSLHVRSINSKYRHCWW